MSGAAAAAAASSNTAEGQATLVGVSASLSAADLKQQSAAYATPVPDSPMPGISQGSSSDVVGATLVGASALRQSQVFRSWSV